jgi:glycine C-acetyltransferase
LQIFVAQPELVTRLKDNISYFVQGMRQLGAPLVADHKSAIVPVTISDEKKMGVMAGSLLDNGIYVIPIVFPAVSRSGCRFRFTVMATHTQSDLDLALSHFEQAMRLADFRFGENESEQPVVNNVKQLGRRVA